MGAREEIGSAIGWQWVTFFSSLVSYIWSWVAGAGAHSWSTTAAGLQTGTCWLLVFGSAIHLGKQHKENWGGFGAHAQCGIIFGSLAAIASAFCIVCVVMHFTTEVGFSGLHVPWLLTFSNALLCNVNLVYRLRLHFPPPAVAAPRVPPPAVVAPRVPPPAVVAPGVPPVLVPAAIETATAVQLPIVQAVLMPETAAVVGGRPVAARPLKEMADELEHQLGLPKGRPIIETIELACVQLGIRPSGNLLDKAQACVAVLGPPGGLPC